ncbi:MAG: hypothetical protein DRI37_00365 [Chloroflexi bacterium]|nr:MAG: hypothetical protein DRI37_00365 [Chloroflexota bacterium]
MELSQLEQMIRWLDEERKKDKTLIATLQERAEQQSLLIEAQARELGELHQDLVSLRADLRHTDDYPVMLEKTQRDLSSAVEELKERLRQEKAEAEHLRQVEREAYHQELGELDKKIRGLARHEEALQAREAGEQRLHSQLQQISNALADLTKRTEDRFQSIPYLEEQRRADTRRIATLEGDIPVIRKATDEVQVKLVRLEDSIRKLPARVDEAVQFVKSYDSKIEKLRVADFQREQRVKQYEAQAQEVKVEIARMLEQTQKYALLHNKNQQALAALESFRTRLEKRQNEIAEMQRLNEERMKREWEEWQTLFARDWQKRQVTEEDRWRRQDLTDQQLTEHLAKLDETTKLYYEEIFALWEELRDAAGHWNKALQDITEPTAETTSRRLKNLRRFAEEEHRDLL